MKDEIIIDGVNVAECEFYDDVECNAYRQEYWEPQDNTKDFCSQHPNCCFKQLQRLKLKKEKNKEKLIKELKKLSRENNTDFEITHSRADKLLIKYINDKDVTEAYDDVGKWYA